MAGGGGKIAGDSHDASRTAVEPEHRSCDSPAASKITRRGVLGGGSALLVGAGLEAQAAPDVSRGLTADVCVVGAGFAGLTAAWRLKQAGRSVIVLEARNRVGGRSLTAPLAGDAGWVDFGGQWVGPTQDRVLCLIKEMGGATYPSPGEGAALQRGIVNPATFDRITDEVHGAYPGSDLVKRAFTAIDTLAAEIDRDKPWTHRDAARLDGMTFAEWLRANIANENVRGTVGGEVASIACASPEEISILEVAFLVRACNGLDKVFSGEGGAQQDRVVGGTQPIAVALAQRLGAAVKLGQPVRRIDWSARGATVHTDRLSVAARDVIVCTPPHLAGAIEYEPSLPTDRVQVTQRWPQGLVIKVQMIYATPFWRRQGLNGASLDHLAMVGETADSGVPESVSRKGILTGFIYAAQARKAAKLDADERRRRVLAEMRAKFGPKALDPLDYHEMNWSTQQWTRGCFTGFLTPGATTQFGSAVRDSIGPLHWAGTETATVWPSFFDGAVRSGERAADLVQARR